MKISRQVKQACRERPIRRAILMTPPNLLALFLHAVKSMNYSQGVCTLNATYNLWTKNPFRQDYGFEVIEIFQPIAEDLHIISLQLRDLENDDTIYVVISNQPLLINNSTQSRSFYLYENYETSPIYIANKKMTPSISSRAKGAFYPHLWEFLHLALLPDEIIRSADLLKPIKEKLLNFHFQFQKKYEVFLESWNKRALASENSAIKGLIITLPQSERSYPPLSTDRVTLTPNVVTGCSDRGLSISYLPTTQWNSSGGFYDGFLSLQCRMTLGLLLRNNQIHTITGLHTLPFGIIDQGTFIDRMDFHFKRQDPLIASSKLPKNHMKWVNFGLVSYCLEKKIPIFLRQMDFDDPSNSRSSVSRPSVSHSTNFSSLSNLWPIEKVHFAGHLQTQVLNLEITEAVETFPGCGSAAIRLVPASKLNQDVITRHLAYTRESGTLSFHNWNLDFDELSKIFQMREDRFISKDLIEDDSLEDDSLDDDFSEDAIEEEEANTVQDESLKKETQEQHFVVPLLETGEGKIFLGHENIASKLHLLLTDFRRLINGSKINITPAKWINLNLNVDRDSFYFSNTYEISETHSGPNQRIIIDNLSKDWDKLLSGFNGSFASKMPRYEKEDLVGFHKDTRPINLKLLRHSGIYAYIVYSCLDYHINKTNSPPHPEKEFKRNLLQQIALLLDPNSARNENPPQLKELLSQTLNDYVEDFIESLLEKFSPSRSFLIFKGGKIIDCQGYLLNEGKLIYLILKELIVRTSAKIFSTTAAHPLFFFTEVMKANPSDLSNTSSSPDQETEDSYFFDIYTSQADPLKFSLRARFEEDSPLENHQLYFPNRRTAKEKELQLFDPHQWVQVSRECPEIKLTLDGQKIEILKPTAFHCQFNVALDEAPKGSRKLDWFELHPEYFLNGKRINLAEAQSLATQGILEHDGKHYAIDLRQIPHIKILSLFWSKLSGQSQGFGLGHSKARDVSSFARHHVLELLALQRAGIPIDGPKEWHEICAYFDNLAHPKNKLRLKQPLEGILKPYQKIGVQWLWDLYNLKIGGILADDMGLGKTLQTLAFVDYVKNQQKPHRSLIIVPVSLVYNWMSEAAKFTPHLKVVSFDPAIKLHGDEDIIICTYGLFALHKKNFERESFPLAFFDEAQNLKNRGTDRFNAAFEFKSTFKVALTGTPLENNLGNLYNIFEIVAPGVLGDLKSFSRQFLNRNSPPTDEEIQFLKAKIKPLILRRTKEQLLTELPPKIETEIKIDFSKAQKNLYKNTALAYSEKINKIIQRDGENKSQLQMLTALLRLRQICSDPSGLPKVNYREIPPKLESLFEIINPVVDEGHSAIIFTQFKTTFQRILNMAENQNLTIFSICGEDSQKQRSQTLKNFNETPGASILLMTLKTGGVGLNLTKASYVFHLEPWWNPAVENQATDRVHRIGQTKSVVVYKLIMRESIEEKVEILKAKKSALFNQMFSDDYFSSESGSDPLESAHNHKPQKIGLTKNDFDLLLS